MVIGYFRHGATLALAALAMALIAAMSLGPAPFRLGYFALGASLFYVSEYGMHRFAFHAPPAPWAFVRKLQHRLHYDHHTDPSRLDLLFLPLWFLGPNLAITGLALWALFGPAPVASAMLGIALAILHYEWAHYVAHIPYLPRTRVGRWLKQYHLRHHFLTEKAGFGVSNPALDVVFRTYLDPASATRSGTTRNWHSLES